MYIQIIIRVRGGSGRWYGSYRDLESAHQAKRDIIKYGDSLGTSYKADELEVQEVVETTNDEGFIRFIPVSEWERMIGKHIGSTENDTETN